MRVKVLVGAFRRLGAHAIRELSRLNDRALCADERAIGERLGLAEGHLDRQVVDRLNIRNVRELGELLTAARRVHAVVGGEDRVGGGEVAAVGPFNARLQFPGDRGQILADAAVFHCRNLRREPGHHLPVLVVTGERFNHQRRGVHVLGAAGQERVHDRNRLPVDDVQMSVRTSRLVTCGQCAGCGHRDRSGAEGQVFDFHV